MDKTEHDKMWRPMLEERWRNVATAIEAVGKKSVAEQNAMIARAVDKSLEHLWLLYLTFDHFDAGVAEQ